MSAAIEVQRALVAALAPLGIAVFDGPPPDAATPFVAIDGGVSGDWSTKDARGREHRLSIAIRSDGAVPAALHALAAAAEDAIEAMPRDLPGHRIASLVLLRSLIVRADAAPWAARLDYRIRTLEIATV